MRAEFGGIAGLFDEFLEEDVLFLLVPGFDVLLGFLVRMQGPVDVVIGEPVDFVAVVAEGFRVVQKVQVCEASAVAETMCGAVKGGGEGGPIELP